MVRNRYAKANNQHLSDGYDKSKPKSYIQYLDANNLYEWAMSQSLPTGGFKWVEDLESLTTTIKRHPADSDVGHILEVDLEYPPELHDIHNDYPLAPERLTVDINRMSGYQKALINKNHVAVPKLVPNLMNKEKYVLHYRKLQLYLQLGLRLTRIHRAIEFN